MSDSGRDVEQGIASPSTSPAQPSNLTRRSFISNLFRLSKTSAEPQQPPPPRPDPAKLAARRVDASARSASGSTWRRASADPSTSVRSVATNDTSAHNNDNSNNTSNAFVQRSAKSTGSLEAMRPGLSASVPPRLGATFNECSQVTERSGGSFTMSGLVRNSVALFGRTSTDPHNQATLTSMWQRYEVRRTNAKAAAMVTRTIEFLDLITTPRRLDLLNPHDWEAVDRRAAALGGDGIVDEEEEEEQGEVPMPKSAIKYAQALLFFFQSKAGVGLSYMWGWGLVINRLGTYEDGSALWSAPSFFKVHQISAGLTFGVCDRSMCLALNDHESVELVMYGRPLVGWDINVVMDYLQAAYEGTVKYEKPLATRVTVDDNRVSAQYETVDGSMIDCSLKAGMALVSDDFHKRLYGQKLEPEDILFNPDLQPPEEFDALYRHLEKLAAESLI